MDWASSEWKQGLTPLAVQKVNALEEKIDKLQKERQQKQLQCECLELALDKEKRKVEKEKQQTTLIQRELQSLGDLCKDFENKQQKLQNEIQNRDSRIGCLEGLLAQTKKDNCRLQQLENDLEELRSIRETSRIEKEQKELSFTSDQKLITHQDSVSGNSGIDILTERGNNQNVLNDNDLLHSYKEKITTLESTIQELRSKLNLLSSNESNEETGNSQLKTPGRPKIEVVEASPAIRARSTLNVWDSFASTPAKENKESFLRHHSDSTALASTDGKVLALQTQLKQLRQELDCQRHNFEASKNSLEQKFKEKENRLKDDMKYQLQVSADLDKELKDTKNKYQQEITQASKKLDVLAAQLKKAEVTNETFKKDMKHMETKINSNNLSLNVREEEVQDLLKQKNAIETSLQSLQTQVFESEKKCKVLEKQNSSLTDNINTVKLQLDGSCNLVQEKENSLAKANKELEIMSISNKNLQDKVQELENILLAEQKINAKFIQDEKILTEKIEVLENEQNQLNDKFTSEIKKSQEFECTIEKQQLCIFSLKNELTEKTANLDLVNKQMIDSKNEFEEKIIDLNNTLKCIQEKSSAFESSLEQCSLRECTIKEKLGHVEREKEELLSKFNIEACKTQELEKSIVEAKQSISLLKEELLNKSCIYEELDNQLKASKDSYEIKIKQSEEKLSAALKDYTTLENQLKESSLTEISLKQKLEQLNKEKEEIIYQLNIENNLRSSLDSKIVELEACNTSLKVELSNKSLECDDLKKKNGELESQSVNKETKVRELEEELITLQNLQQLISENELHLKEHVQLLENEKKELGVQLMEETSKVQNLSTCHEELKSEISSLQEELLNKSLESQNIIQAMEISSDELKIKVNELNKRLSATLEDYATLENQLKECAVNETSLKQKLDEASSAKEELTSQFLAENNLRQNLEIQLNDLQSKYECLKEEFCAKSSEYDELKNKFMNLETEYKAQTEELEDKMTAALSEVAASQKHLQSISSHETELRDQLDVLLKEKEKLNYNLTEETKKVHDALMSNEELKSNISSLQEELSCNISELERISQIMERSSDQFKIEVQLLEEKLSNENNQSSCMKQQLEVSLTNERMLLEEINSLKEEKILLEEKLIVSKDKIQELESSSVELNQNIQVLNDKMCKESSELEKVHDQMMSKKEHVAMILELEEKLSDMNLECINLKNELKNFLSQKNSIEEKLKLSEEKNSELNEKLVLEISKTQSLQSNIEEIKTSKSLLEEQLSLKSSHLSEYEKKIQDLQLSFDSDQTKHAELENQLQEFVQKEALFKENILKLQSEVDDFSRGSKAVDEEMQKLKSVIDEQQVIVQDLERKQSDTLTENQFQLQKFKDDKALLLNRIDLLIIEKDDIAACLEREISKRQNLELNIEGWKTLVISLEEDLSCMSLECEKIDNEYELLKNNYENKKRELESKLSVSQTEQTCQIEEWNAKEVSLKNKLQLLEEEHNEISLYLTAEIQKNKELEVQVKQLDEVMKENRNIQTKIQELENELLASNKEYSLLTSKLQESSTKQSFLKEEVDVLTKVKQECELKIKDLNTHVSSLEESLSLKTFEQDELIHQNMVLKEDFEIEVQNLKQKLSFTEKELSDLCAQLEEMKSKEKNPDEILQLLEKENFKLNENSNAASEQIQKLELDVKESQRLNKSLEEELCMKSVKMDELAKEIEALKSEYLIEVQNLKQKLSFTEKELSDLCAQLEEMESKEKNSDEILQLLEKENLKLNENSNAASEQIQKLELDVKESQRLNKSLEEELCMKSVKMDELAKEIEALKSEYLIEVQNLKQKLSFTEKELSDLCAQLEEMESKEKNSDEILQLLEKENLKLNENSNAASEQIQKLELDVKESQRLNKSLEEELCMKSVKMDELAKEIEALKSEYLIEVQNLKQKLSFTEKELSDLCTQLEEMESKEKNSDEILQLLEKENLKLNENSNAASEQIQKLELDVKESQRLNKSLEEELCMKSVKMDELAKEIEALKSEYLWTVQKLQGQITAAKTENELLHIKVKNYLLSEELWQKILETIEKEKHNSNRQLLFLSNKIRVLELGVKELKKIILTLQVLLISNSGDTGVNNEMIASKECNKIQSDYNCPVNQTKYCSATKVCITSASELKSFSCSQDKDFSGLLHDFSTKTLNKMCDLEYNLIDKLEKCKFLCNHQLISFVELNKMKKIFLCLRRNLIQIQLLKKFMICFCAILKSNLSAYMLRSANEIVLVKIFPKEFCFTLQNFLYLCNNTFNKILFSISQTFEKCLSIDKHFIFFKNHSNIHNSDLHRPVVPKTAYLLYLAKFNKIRVTSKPTCILRKKLNVMFPQGELNAVKSVDLLSIHETPFFLNFVITLYDWISKMCCNASNAVDVTPTAEFCYSAFQLKNFLPSMASSSPIFHVFWKYYKEILDVKADILDEVCYWKYHYNILGINKNDILKIITQLEKRSKNEEKLNKDTQLKINSFTEENHALQPVKESLEHSLKVEKEKQRLLNATIEEIEKDLGETFLQKEKFKNMALNTNKLLLCLKKHNDISFVFSDIRLVGEIYSDTCFCEKCILEEETSNDSSHDILTLKYCFEWIDRLIHAGCQLERELKEFRQHKSDLRILYEKLQDENSQLEMTVDAYSKDLKNVNSEIENVRYELKKQIEKNEILSKSIDKKDTLELELCNNIEENKKIINELEHKIILLSTDKEKIEFDVLCKEKEITSLKSLIDEKTHLFEKIHLKCDEYENKISLLNSTISRLEEEKALNEHLSSLNQSHNLGSSIESDCFDGKSSKTIINELQNQINSLKESNDSLNLNIKNMEGELNNLHLEKQNAVEKLQKLSEEISSFSQKYNDEKKTTRDLLLKLNDFENLKNDTEGIINQLKCKNESLEKDINVLKFVNREHEQEIFKKNSDLEKCHHLIEQLQNKIEKEQSNFKIQIKNSEKSDKLKIQLKEMIAIKSNLEEEISKLKLVETEKTEILKKLTEMEFQKNSITQQFDKLKSEMKETEENNQKLKMECKELRNLLNDMKILKTTLEEDLNKKENCIACLNSQLEHSSAEHAKLRKMNSELSAEVSSLKKAENSFQQEIESLTKQLKDLMKNIKIESNEKQQLKIELEDMKERVVKSHKLVNVYLEPEFQKTKNGLNNALNFISNIFKIILNALENYNEYSNSEVLKSDITSLMIHWKKNPEEQFQVHIFDHLRLFFKTLIDKQIEDSAVSKHVTSIVESLNNIRTLCESNQNTNSPMENISNLSLFEKTFTKNSLERNDYSPTNIITDLLCIKKEIDSCFCSLKSIICEKTEEINMLKGKLHEFSSKANDCNCKSSDMDKTSFKWKYELYKRQNRQLEEKYNKVAVLAEEMEKSMKLLQEEKLSLEEEADELCNELKKLEVKYASSEELINALEELNMLKQKLRDTENENNWLKRNLREIQLCQVKDSKQIASNNQNQTELSMFERPCLKKNFVKR